MSDEKENIVPHEKACNEGAEKQCHENRCDENCDKRGDERGDEYDQDSMSHEKHLGTCSKFHSFSTNECLPPKN